MQTAGAFRRPGFLQCSRKEQNLQGSRHHGGVANTERPYVTARCHWQFSPDEEKSKPATYEVNGEAKVVQRKVTAAEPVLADSLSRSEAIQTREQHLQSTEKAVDTKYGPTIMVSRPLPRVLILHTGGTLGMDTQGGYDDVAASGASGLRPAAMLANVLSVVPELRKLSNVDLEVVFNKDSSRVGPQEWIQIARILDANRSDYDAFMIIHGTDTMAYTAAALSLMLRGFRRPVVMTGSQLPLAAPRTDARQNLLDSIQCALGSFSPPHVNLQEVAICFGGRLLRGNRTRKVHSSSYQAFDSPGYPHLAQLGIDVEWNERALLRPEGAYVPRFNLDPRVIRVPVVPGVDPRDAYGDLHGRGIRGIVLEVFGVGNIPDLPEMGWIPWLREQMTAGLQVALVSQCNAGPLQPDLYAAGGALSALTTKPTTAAGSLALHDTLPLSFNTLGSSIGPGGSMTPECAVVKMMMVLAYPSLAVGEAISGEL